MRIVGDVAGDARFPEPIDVYRAHHRLGKFVIRGRRQGRLVCSAPGLPLEFSRLELAQAVVNQLEQESVVYYDIEAL
jgi:hypothetical protein